VPAASADRLVEDLRAGKLTADALIANYCRLVYRQSGSYEQTARRIGLDRRTVKRRILEPLP
jgi:hypothetical protein